MKKIAALPAEKARERKRRIGSIGSRRAQLPGDERRHEQHAGRERAEHLGAAPAGLLPRTRPQTMPERAGA